MEKCEFLFFLIMGVKKFFECSGALPRFRSAKLRKSQVREGLNKGERRERGAKVVRRCEKYSLLLSLLGKSARSPAPFGKPSDAFLAMGPRNRKPLSNFSELISGGRDQRSVSAAE